MDRPLPWWLFLASSGILQSVSLEQGAVPSCPSLCHCEEDGIMLSVDCSELALSSVPDGLSPLTAYLASPSDSSLLQAFGGAIGSALEESPSPALEYLNVPKVILQREEFISCRICSFHLPFPLPGIELRDMLALNYDRNLAYKITRKL
ncbi:Leucine-rich repeat-containing G-protein coupled receptor 6 [Varanus komodoensis]|nr:Leucine-rich repeat-containing G-protein coupled receptor 6 [Varanus komodoensis]